jgi:hypothetical protein
LLQGDLVGRTSAVEARKGLAAWPSLGAVVRRLAAGDEEEARPTYVVLR